MILSFVGSKLKQSVLLVQNYSATQELKILRKLQTQEDALDMRCQAKLAEDADIVVRASYKAQND